MRALVSSSLVAFLALSACTTDSVDKSSSPPSESRATPGVSKQAYKAHKVAEAINGFKSVCLMGDLSASKAATKAKELGLGLSAPTRVRISGSPKFHIAARINDEAVEDADGVFDEYNCQTRIRGTWAEEVAPQIETIVRDQGYQFVKSFAREQGSSSDREELVSYSAVVRKNGRVSSLSVHHGSGSRETRGNTQHIYISGTIISLRGLR